jgi:hypothetical protein
MKILVAYYSKGGGTKKIAETLKLELEGRGHIVDMEEVVPEKEHNFFAWWHIRFFKGQCEIKPLRVNDLSKYDAICIGSPNWTRISLPMAKYLDKVTGLKNKKIGFFSSTAAPPGIEWYILSAYLLDLSLNRIIEKKKARIVSSILLSGGSKRWGPFSEYGKKIIKDFCDKISAPASPLKKYTLRQKEIEESRMVIVFLLVFNILFIAAQIISFFSGKQIIGWGEFSMFLMVSFLAYFIIVTILGSKKALFLGKYIIITAAVFILTLGVMFLGGNIGSRITIGYLFLFMMIFFFHNVRAVIFSGFLAILSYFFLFSSDYLTTDLNPIFDIPIIVLGVFITGIITLNLKTYFFKLLEAQDEADEARISLEIKISARTRELKELADGLEENIKIRTAELQQKIEELEKFNKLTIGRELRMIELKKEIKRLEEELQNVNKNLK